MFSFQLTILEHNLLRNPFAKTAKLVDIADYSGSVAIDT